MAWAMSFCGTARDAGLWCTSLMAAHGILLATLMPSALSWSFSTLPLLAKHRWVLVGLCMCQWKHAGLERSSHVPVDVWDHLL